MRTVALPSSDLDRDRATATATVDRAADRVGLSGRARARRGGRSRRRWRPRRPAPARGRRRARCRRVRPGRATARACPSASTPPSRAPCRVTEPASVRNRSSRRTSPPSTAFATSAGSRGRPSRSARSGTRPAARRPRASSGRIADRRQIRERTAGGQVGWAAAGRRRVAADHPAHHGAQLAVGVDGDDQDRSPGRSAAGQVRPSGRAGPSRRAITASISASERAVTSSTVGAAGSERVTAGQHGDARARCAVPQHDPPQPAAHAAQTGGWRVGEAEDDHLRVRGIDQPPHACGASGC